MHIILFTMKVSTDSILLWIASFNYRYKMTWEGNGRWIHVSYVPGNLKCEVIE